MGKLRKISSLIGLKGILSIACLTTIAVALVVYSASVTMTPKFQFTRGAQSDLWDIYLNEVNQVRYLPGGSAAAAPNDLNLNTFAFKVVTDATKVCAVKIELTSVMDSGKFTNFDITVNYWDGGAWSPVPLYASETGSTTITAINGLSSGAAGYIHQGISAATFYIVKVTYSYDKVTDAASITVPFQYTPLARASF